MKINLWYSDHMKQWRWTLVDDTEDKMTMEAGNQQKLTNAMEDICKTVKYLREQHGLSTD
jgi:hypothetical protein